MRVPVAAVMVAVSGATLAGSAGAERIETADYRLAYTYPAEVAAIPRLRATLEAERKQLKAATAHDAAAARSESKKGGFPFRAYDTQKTWKVVTTTPRFLSLSSDAYEYTGGAHGNPSSGALLWDRKRGVSLDPEDVFTSRAALQRAIAPTYCARLKAERERRLAPHRDTSDTFGKCPTLKELTLLLGSSTRRRIDRIGLIADPYVAGSYAEGAYEVTLPVTPAILRTVVPRYRAAFAVQ